MLEKLESSSSLVHWQVDGSWAFVREEWRTLYFETSEFKVKLLVRFDRKLAQDNRVTYFIQLIQSLTNMTINWVWLKYERRFPRWKEPDQTKGCSTVFPAMKKDRKSRCVISCYLGRQQNLILMDLDSDSANSKLPLEPIRHLTWSFCRALSFAAKSRFA